MTKNVELQLTNDYIFKRLFSKKGNEIGRASCRERV